MHHIKFFGLVKLSDSNVKCNSYTNKFNLVFFLRVKGSGLFFFFCQSETLSVILHVQICRPRFGGRGLIQRACLS